MHDPEFRPEKINELSARRQQTEDTWVPIHAHLRDAQLQITRLRGEIAAFTLPGRLAPAWTSHDLWPSPDLLQPTADPVPEASPT